MKTTIEIKAEVSNCASCPCYYEGDDCGATYPCCAMCQDCDMKISLSEVKYKISPRCPYLKDN